MKICFRILLIFFVIAFKINAQNIFEINFGNKIYDFGYSIQQTFDEKYIVTGMTDSSGHSNVLLAKIDTDGAVLWSNSLGGILEEAGNCIVQTSDSGFAIVGYTSSFGNGQYDVYLIKTDVNGNILWTKTYGGNNNDLGFVVKNTLDGGLIIGGQENSTASGPTHMYLIKTNAQGDTIWTKSYATAVWNSMQGIVQTPDSGYLIIGDIENVVSGNGDFDLAWMKIDSHGNLIWTKTLVDPTIQNWSQAIRRTYDGGFIIASELEDIFNLKIGSKLVRLDVNGDTLWTKQFGINYSYNIRDVVQTPDSGFANVGCYYDSSLHANKLFITKLDLDGDSIWTKYYNKLFSSIGYSIENTVDGGLIISGITSDSTPVQSDVYVIKTDGNGDVFVCQPVILSQPQNTAILEGSNGEFIVGTSQPGLSFQWQIDSAGTFVNLNDGGNYSGTNSDTLHLTGVLLSMNGYNFRCIISESLNCIDTSSSATLNTFPIGITELSSHKNILFPNPASNQLQIFGKIPERIILYDIYGKVISEFKNEQKIDVSFLADGIYYLKLFYQSENATCKFVKK